MLRPLREIELEVFLAAQELVFSVGFLTLGPVALRVVSLSHARLVGGWLIATTGMTIIGLLFYAYDNSCAHPLRFIGALGSGLLWLFLFWSMPTLVLSVLSVLFILTKVHIAITAWSHQW
jgi:hypothetical protein